MGNITLKQKDIVYLREVANKEVLEFLDNKIEQQELSIKRRKIGKLKAIERKKGVLKYKAEEFKKDLIKKITPSESKFKAILNHLKINYEFQKIIYYQKSFYIVDFYIPKLNIIFEIDGDYHNFQKGKDIKRTRLLKEQGISKVYRFTNSEVENNTNTIMRIERILNKFN